jgi:hypothetical protein
MPDIVDRGRARDPEVAAFGSAALGDCDLYGGSTHPADRAPDFRSIPFCSLVSSQASLSPVKKMRILVVERNENHREKAA